MAAVGGWDVRNSHPGDALADACLLDHDLVRQVREGMNRIKIFRGYYDSRFGRNKAKVKGGDSGGKERMAPDPVHILTESEASNTSEAVKALRADVRYFKWINGVVGHTTVIWCGPTDSLLSENGRPDPSESKRLDTATELLEAIDVGHKASSIIRPPLPPWLLYATAAVLEGCSFVHAGRTGHGRSVDGNPSLPRGLLELAQRHPGVYCLGGVSGLATLTRNVNVDIMGSLRAAGLRVESVLPLVSGVRS